MVLLMTVGWLGIRVLLSRGEKVVGAGAAHGILSLLLRHVTARAVSGDPVTAR